MVSSVPQPNRPDRPTPPSQTTPSASRGFAEQDLDEAMAGFRDMVSDLNYQQAHEALRELVDSLDLSQRERSGLDAELTQLNLLMAKLEQQVIQIAVFGMVGRGKSSLLNALLGQQIFETGPTHGVTQSIHSANWAIQEESVVGSDRNIVRVALPSVGGAQVELVDTPGIDEVDGESREFLAKEVAQQADLILFVVAGDITRVEFDALTALRQASKPMVLVLNKVDQYPDADRQVIYQKIRDERVRSLLSPDEIVMASAAPITATAVRKADGTTTVRMNRSQPQVDELKLKILELLHREGKSLVALNSMLYANDMNERIVQRKMDIRDRSANQVIWSSVLTKSVAIALNPLMLVDVLSSATIDIAMIVALSRLYGLPMTQKGALGLLQTIALGLGGITASELLVTLGLSSLKTLFAGAAPISGGLSLAPYASVAVTQAAVAGVSSYTIGQVAKTYLANGASWGPDGPKTVVHNILESLDETSILNRIKDELWAKLDLQSRHRETLETEESQ
ncbi:DUF697 domain-containing protein [Leptolyngbya sp. AN02str]|uniref:GTP-binding protein n=1 Tax=Leptolyngbya sp. AN02str TaxID=3423363 RepID=UPI003D315D30